MIEYDICFYCQLNRWLGTVLEKVWIVKNIVCFDTIAAPQGWFFLVNMIYVVCCNVVSKQLSMIILYL